MPSALDHILRWYMPLSLVGSFYCSYFHDLDRVNLRGVNGVYLVGYFDNDIWSQFHEQRNSQKMLRDVSK